ncbi:SMP-30/gluconolactonase/LRE family protein [Starkeya sp. ORNL1]|uniref:SMP-30/gluconolactonase/LRE family protein n=1 Tax=Starkeya sp. ORNL1 TaxID=2709380 RepID=UPI001463333A|nr:SMP-30/gluconolactonase/LRE family protein [Starkeya sp. ORNL1]QJP13064.1 SMP-30/gluconolactonase/LRE family protein [Starkeya sp. ORNL1]
MKIGTRFGTDLATDALDAIVDREPQIEQIAHGLLFGEGPVWDARENRLIWTDIIGDTIWQWKPGVGVSAFLEGSRHANGLTFDRQGRLNVAGWSARTIWRIEHDGRFVDVASRYDGKKFNSPNDIVVRSDGRIYWTDSAGGLVIPGMVGEDLQRYLDIQGVYSVGVDGGETSLVVPDVTYPNGLCFSPDESILYVNDTRLALIRAFDVAADGSVSNGRIFHRLAGTEPGVADGMKVDRNGTLYCTGPGGIHVIATDGSLIGRIRIAGHATNLAWGEEDWRTLFVTTYENVLRIRMKQQGIPVPVGGLAR